MSGRTIYSRPRTRVYDANYNIGESYYKSALDRIDRKYSGRPTTPPREANGFVADVAERHAAAFDGEDLSASRKRAEKLINSEHIFDSRSGRLGRRPFEDDIDDDTSAAVRRIRANKKVSIIDDVDLENTSNSLKTFRLLDRSDKILDSVGINEKSRRALDEQVTYKRRSAIEKAEAEASTLEKWTPVSSTVAEERSSAAQVRARQSKDRLNDLEEEMAAIADRQAARERRVAKLRALVAESEAETVVDEETVSATRKERKSVRF